MSSLQPQGGDAGDSRVRHAAVAAAIGVTLLALGALRLFGSTQPPQAARRWTSSNPAPCLHQCAGDSTACRITCDLASLDYDSGFYVIDLTCNVPQAEQPRLRRLPDMPHRAWGPFDDRTEAASRAEGLAAQWCPAVDQGIVARSGEAMASAMVLTCKDACTDAAKACQASCPPGRVEPSGDHAR